MTLRDYQTTAINKIRIRWWAGFNRLICKFATGLGKTPLFAALPDELQLEKRMMVIVHRDELAQQAADKLRRWNPSRTVGIEMGGNQAGDAELVVGGVQTLGRAGSKRLQEIDPTEFSALVVDEAHHSTADTYKRVFNHFGVFNSPDILLVGVTATPNRSDGKGLNEIYQEIVEDKDILFGIRSGWLVDLKGIRVKTTTNLDGVHNRAGDFDQGELGKAVNTEIRNEAVVNGWLQHGQDRQTIAYCVDIQHAKDLAAAFKRVGIAAEAVWGADPDRAEKLAFHREGKLKVLTNCEVLTEGYDDWRVGCIIIARPTQSESLYTQIVGRGTRIPDGIGNLVDARKNGVKIDKEDCILIDTVDVTSKHSLVSLPTLFGMNQEMDLKGKSIVDVVDDIDDIKKNKPFVDVTKVTDVNKLRTYAEEVDLFRIEFMPEILQWSEFCWHKSGNDAYVLLMPDKESVVILRDVLDNWRIIGKVRGLELNDQRPTLKDALEEADYQVRLHGGRNVNALVKRKSAWRDQPPTDLQMALCKKLKINVPTGATRGEVSLRLDWHLNKKKAA